MRRIGNGCDRLTEIFMKILHGFKLNDDLFMQEPERNMMIFNQNELKWLSGTLLYEHVNNYMCIMA